MTDQEYQELVEKVDRLNKERISTGQRHQEEFSKLTSEYLKASKLKEEEDLRRCTEKGMSEFKKLVRESLDHRNKFMKTTDELWMVEIEGHKFKSTKGKYTWTSEGRARAAVANYLDYNGPWEIRRARVSMKEIIQELIKDGYIKIIRVV